MRALSLILKNKLFIISYYFREAHMTSEEIQYLIIREKVKDKILNIIGHDLKEVAYSHNALTEKITFLMNKNRIDDIQKLSNHIQSRADMLISIVEKLNTWSKTERENLSTGTSLDDDIKIAIDNYLKMSNHVSEHLSSSDLKAVAQTIIKNKDQRD